MCLKENVGVCVKSVSLKTSFILYVHSKKDADMGNNVQCSQKDGNHFNFYLLKMYNAI